MIKSFLKLDHVVGSVVGGSHAGWSEIRTFSRGSKPPGAGRSSRRLQPLSNIEIHVLKDKDAASVPLLRYFRHGQLSFLHKLQVAPSPFYPL